MTSKDYALTAAQAADEKKGVDIIIQDVAELLGVTDFFVIVTANNRPHVESIVDAVEEALRVKCGIKPISVEGDNRAEWILLDYGNIVVHVFQPEIRDFYRLETLWGDAPVVEFEQTE